MHDEFSSPRRSPPLPPPGGNNHDKDDGDEDDDDVDDFEDGELEGDNDDEYVRGMIHPPCVHQRRGLFLQGTQSQCIDAKIRRKPF